MSQAQESKDVAPEAIEAEKVEEISAADLDEVNGGSVEVTGTIKWTSPK